MREPELHDAAPALEDSEELWEGLLFCEEPEEELGMVSQTPVERAACDDDAPGTTPGDDADRLMGSMHDLLHGDAQADKVRHRVLELHADRSCKDAGLQQLGEALAAAFPDHTVFLREAIGSTLRSICLQRLRHKSLVMRRAQPSHASEVYRTSCDDALIIDLSFRGSFSVPNPSPRYQSILDLLPDVFVATTPTFTAAVELLAKEMADSFKAQQMLTPPWRSAQALLSKWSPITTTDTLLGRPSPTPAPPSFQAAVPAPVAPQQAPQRATAPHHHAAKATGKPATPAGKLLGIKELLDIPVYSPRRTARRRPRPAAKPTVSSSPSAPPSKLRAIFNGSPPTYTPSEPLPFKAAAWRKAYASNTTALAASPSTPPVKRPYTTAAAHHADQARQG